MKTRALAAALLLALPVVSANAGSLHGSHASMVRQHDIALRNDFTFLRSAKQIREFAENDRLDFVGETEDYRPEDVSFPYARPIVKLFIERLAAQYRAATGDPLVITSLTRPLSRQPRNASPLSVHPAGMAVDFRVPAKSSARKWLERTLLSLEDKGLLDVTREHHPPHYHVAVFPTAYASYVSRIPIVAEEVTQALPAAKNIASAPRVALSAVAGASTESHDSLRASVFTSAIAGLILLIGAIRLRRRVRR